MKGQRWWRRRAGSSLWFSSVYLLSFCSSFISFHVCLVSTEKKWLLLLWARWRLVWGYVDREGCFRCRGRNGREKGMPGWGLVLGALSLSRSCPKEMEMSGLSGRVRWGNRGRCLAMGKRQKKGSVGEEEVREEIWFWPTERGDCWSMAGWRGKPRILKGQSNVFSSLAK
jgi:hypothetical protein